MNDGVTIKGFARLQIRENGEIIGDTGWQRNRVVNEGFDNYLTRLISAQAGSLQVSRMLLGTGGLPATDATALPGELNTATYTRTTLTVSVVDSSAVEFQATFASSSSHITNTTNLSNIGLINNTTSGGSIFAGITYASSQWNTNQDINASYRITFS